MQISYSLNNIDEAARRFLDFASSYRVYAFSGDMGAGKTTFISSLCRMLGIADAVSSPTFALINEYMFRDPAGQQRRIFHMDWYRIKDEEDAFSAGIEDYLSGSDYCFVEWPERILELLHSPYLWCHIEVTGTDERRMTITVK